MLLLRWQDLQKFLRLPNRSFFPHKYWHRRFFIGVAITGAVLGCGAAALMPFVTSNVQFILHVILLIMCAGAIAYLATSFPIYIIYMLTMMLPVTVWLLLQNELVSYVLGCLYAFFMAAGWVSVRHMNRLVNDALYYRYDNEALIEDLQLLLQSVSRSNKALEKISTTDEISGLSNYRAFRVHLEEIWRQYRESAEPVALLKLNLDRFHAFNAEYGQQEGDRVLRRIANLLGAEVKRENQLAARLQGAEFALLLPGSHCREARELAERIAQAAARRDDEERGAKAASATSLSIGIGCQTVREGSASRELLVRADTALKLARERGGDRIEVLEG